MSNLTKRILTGFFAGIFCLFIIVYSQYGFWLFCAVASVLGLWEFYHILGAETKRNAIPILVTSLLIWFALLINFPDRYFFAGLILVFPLAGIITLFDKSAEGTFQSLGTLVLGLVYCYLPLILFYRLPFTGVYDHYQYWVPLRILFLTWGMDTAAYFSGRYLGKHPLLPRISPKKTWEGVIGGALFCIILSVLFEIYGDTSQINWIIVGVIIAIFNQVGDLIESLLKRSVEIKDSGNILPGHGGILDRFDSLYICVPLIYFYFCLL